MLTEFKIFDKYLTELPEGKLLINTINAYSYNIARRDKKFEESLKNCEVLIPDGISIVFAKRFLDGSRLKKIAGADLFCYEMKRLNEFCGKVFFLGSSERTLKKIKERAAIEFPDVKVFTYSPPYKAVFSSEENEIMINEVNQVKPDVLFVGMTAPKQEKWAYVNYDKLDVGHIDCIGAVFDFYAGTIRRAPNWMIKIGLEWFFRFCKEPKRLWKRYLIGNTFFFYYMLVEKIRS
ncbi:MAG: WecB/TagA/CpsF family glycosyltransferase [Cyclobacteriaceae bacterium]